MTPDEQVDLLRLADAVRDLTNKITGEDVPSDIIPSDASTFGNRKGGVKAKLTPTERKRTIETADIYWQRYLAIVEAEKTDDEEKIKTKPGQVKGKTPVQQSKDQLALDGGNSGLMGVIGKGLSALGVGLKGLGKGFAGLAKGISKFGNAKAAKGALVVVGLSTSLFILAKGLQEFTKVDAKAMLKAGVALGGLFALMRFMPKVSKVKKTSLGILAITAAVFLLGKAIQVYNDISPESMIKAGIAITALTGVAILAAKFSKDMIKGAAGLLVLAPAIYLLGKAINTFSEVDWKTVGVASVAILAIGALGAAAGLVAGNIALGGLALMVMAPAIWLLGKAINEFADVDWKTVGIMSVAILAIGALGAAAGFVAPLIALGGLALMVMAPAIWLLGKAINEFADVDWKTIGIMSVAILAIGALGAAAGFVSPLIAAGGLALMIMAPALWLLSQALKQFSNMDLKTIGIVSAALLAVGILGAAAGIAAPLLVLGSIGIALFSGALWLLGKVMSGLGGIDMETNIEHLWALLKAGSALGVAVPLFILATVGLAVMSGGLYLVGKAINFINVDQFQAVIDKLIALKDIDPVQIGLLGFALISLSAGLAALGVGSGIGKVADAAGGFFGSLFDKGKALLTGDKEKTKSPFEKLIELGKVAPDLNKLAKSLDTLKKAADIPFDKIASGLLSVIKAVWRGNKLLDNWMGKKNMLSVLADSFNKIQTERLTPFFEKLTESLTILKDLESKGLSIGEIDVESLYKSIEDIEPVSIDGTINITGIQADLQESLSISNRHLASIEVNTRTTNELLRSGKFGGGGASTNNIMTSGQQGGSMNLSPGKTNTDSRADYFSSPYSINVPGVMA